MLQSCSSQRTSSLPRTLARALATPENMQCSESALQSLQLECGYLRNFPTLQKMEEKYVWKCLAVMTNISLNPWRAMTCTRVMPVCAEDVLCGGQQTHRCGKGAAGRGIIIVTIVITTTTIIIIITTTVTTTQQSNNQSINRSINQSVNKKWINGSKMNQQQSMWSDIIHYEAVSSNTKFHFSSNIHTNTMISISIWNITWATCYLKYIQTPNYRIECIFLYLNTVST